MNAVVYLKKLIFPP